MTIKTLIAHDGGKKGDGGNARGSSKSQSQRGIRKKRKI